MVGYYISSKDLSARELAEAARQHWFIETEIALVPGCWYE